MNQERVEHRPRRKSSWLSAHWRSSAGGLVIALFGVFTLAGGARDWGRLVPNSAEAFDFRPRPAPELPAPELADAPDCSAYFARCLTSGFDDRA
jgi:hypothetical protein